MSERMESARLWRKLENRLGKLGAEVQGFGTAHPSFDGHCKPLVRALESASGQPR